MTTATLPVELAEQIIDCLCKNTHGLLTCSIVARGWRPRALSYLFRFIQIRDASYTVFSLGHMRVYGTLYFARFQETMPHLLLHLRHLSFFADGGPHDADSGFLSFIRNLQIVPPVDVHTLSVVGNANWSSALRNIATLIPSFQHITLPRPMNIFPAQTLRYLEVPSLSIVLPGISDPAISGRHARAMLRHLACASEPSSNPDCAEPQLI